MAEYTDDREPVVVREREVVRDDVHRDEPVHRSHSATPYIMLLLLVLVVVGFYFVRYNPFASGNSTNVNVNVPTPTLNK